MPGVPTVAESGYPGFEATNWYAFVASGKMPKEMLDYWNRELIKVLKDPRFAPSSPSMAWTRAGHAQELAQYFERESRQVGKGRAGGEDQDRMSREAPRIHSP